MRWKSDEHRDKFYAEHPVRRIAAATVRAQANSDHLVNGIKALCDRSMWLNLGDMLDTEKVVVAMATEAGAWANVALDEVEEIQKDAYDQGAAVGYDAGYDSGYEAGSNE